MMLSTLFSCKPSWPQSIQGGARIVVKSNDMFCSLDRRIPTPGNNSLFDADEPAAKPFAPLYSPQSAPRELNGADDVALGPYELA